MTRALFSFLVFILFALPNMQAQSTGQREVISFDADRLSTVQHVSVSDAAPFLATSVKWETTHTPGELQIRHRNETGQWSAWEKLAPDPHATAEAPDYISQLLFLPADTRAIQLDFAGPDDLIRAEVHLFNPGHTPPPGDKEQTATMRSNCPCPQPEFEGRDDWCPSGNCPQDPTPQPTPVTHVIVHHSAGTNSSNDWAAVVRSIWDFHVNTNGWDDIGYNWLVDPNGVLYEGRGDGLQGAHFCGQNGNTVGICMLGNFQNTSPSNASLLRLQDYLAWQTCDLGVDPLDFGFHEGSGLSLFYISGHRDGCSTACPGDQFYPAFPQLREAVAAYIDNDCMPVAEPIELTAEALSTTSVQLDWAEVFDAETGYEIERSQNDPNNFAWIASVNAATTAYIDANLTPGNYYYRVRAFGPSGSGAYSNEAFVSTIGVRVMQNWYPEQIQSSPNPFRETLQLELTDPFRGIIRFDLINTAGQIVQELGKIQKSETTLQLQWQMHDIPAGSYFLRARANSGQFIMQVIKQ